MTKIVVVLTPETFHSISTIPKLICLEKSSISVYVPYRILDKLSRVRRSSPCSHTPEGRPSNRSGLDPAAAHSPPGAPRSFLRGRNQTWRKRLTVWTIFQNYFQSSTPFPGPPEPGEKFRSPGRTPGLI